MLSFGTPGGDQQDQWSLEFFLAHTAFRLDLQAAIDAPMFHTTHFPSSFYPRAAQPRRVEVERRLPAATLDALRARGHDVLVGDEWEPRAVERDLALAGRAAARRGEPARDAGVRGRALSACAPLSAVAGQPRGAGGGSPLRAPYAPTKGDRPCIAEQPPRRCGVGKSQEFPTPLGRVERPMSGRLDQLDDSRLAKRVRAATKPPSKCSTTATTGRCCRSAGTCWATPRTARTRSSRRSCARTARCGRASSRTRAPVAVRDRPESLQDDHGGAAAGLGPGGRRAALLRRARRGRGAARRPARAGRRPRPAARGPAGGSGPVRARRDLAGRDRRRDRRSGRQGQGPGLPGPRGTDGRARRPLDPVRVDPRGAGGRARRRPAPRAAAPPSEPLRPLPGLPRGRATQRAGFAQILPVAPALGLKAAVLAAAAGKGAVGGGAAGAGGAAGGTAARHGVAQRGHGRRRGGGAASGGALAAARAAGTGGAAAARSRSGGGATAARAAVGRPAARRRGAAGGGTGAPGASGGAARRRRR